MKNRSISDGPLSAAPSFPSAACESGGRNAARTAGRRGQEWPSARRTDAFTLVEMLVVAAIIAVLIGIVIGVSNFSNRKAALSRAIADMEMIKAALEEYRIQHGRYFGPASGSLVGPVTNISVSGVTFASAMSNYVKDLRLVDPWGQGYYYSNSAAMPFAYRIWSSGPNLTNAADDIESGVGYF
ncbi:MAG: type II secretion system GspH family protein [Kiritimatiellae bacterium]|nr:type II secretion system GspH family protein [Kiritimatiellia bacterium]MDW8457594.1 type II secretion system protein GspG [Verrucomicrobiota bacterium]